MNAYRLIESAWTLTVVAVLALVVWTLLGCAAPAQCLKPAVTLERPTLPAVPAARLQCLDDATYAALVDRELRLREYGEQCEAILREVVE